MSASLNSASVPPELGRRGRLPSLPARVAIVLGVLALMLAFAVSLVLRSKDFRPGAEEPNIDASYHVLYTVDTLNVLPLSESFLLPTVTLNNPRDRGVPWGGALPTRNGVYVYTSFMPIGFLVPWLFFKLTGLPGSLHSLMIFNAMLGASATVLLFGVLYKMLRLTGYGTRAALFAGVAGAAVLIFSREGLHSFGMVYWHQSLEQVWLLAQLLLLLQVWSQPRARWMALLAVVSFFSASTEWTGIAGNMTLAVLLAAIAWRYPNQISYRPALCLAAATSAALGVLFLHLFIAIGAGPTVSTLFGRFMVRSGAHSSVSMMDLLQGYSDSFGLFLVFALAGALLLNFLPRREARPALVGFVLVAAALPLVENLLLLQHAVLYTFDRLKLVTLLAVIVAVVMARALQTRSIPLVALLGVALLLSAGQNIKTYHHKKEALGDWSARERDNERIRNQVASAVSLDCATLGTSLPVRGYMNLLFGRAISELTAEPDFLRQAAQQSNCGAIYLDGVSHGDGIPELSSALIVRADGSRQLIKPEAATH